jgi:hypothetical protein
MQPAPRQKPPQISPIFTSDKVTLHVSRVKDGKFRLVYAGWDDAKVVQPNGCGQARRRWKGGSYPPGRGSGDPPFKKLGPPSGPPGFSGYGCRSPASNRALFALVFEVALRVTAPLRYA